MRFELRCPNLSRLLLTTCVRHSTLTLLLQLPARDLKFCRRILVAVLHELPLLPHNLFGDVSEIDPAVRHLVCTS